MVNRVLNDERCLTRKREAQKYCRPKKNVFIAWGRKTYGAFEIIQHQVMGFERG